MKTPLYEVIEHPDVHDHAAIQLLDGPYQGVTYKYGTVSFAESGLANDGVTLSFDWEVIDAPDHPGLEESEEFKDIVCEILNSILEKEFKIGHGA